MQKVFSASKKKQKTKNKKPKKSRAKRQKKGAKEKTKTYKTNITVKTMDDGSSMDRRVFVEKRQIVYIEPK